MSGQMQIRTDNKWHQFKYRYEVPESVLRDQFDYQDPEDVQDGYFQYRGYWYHMDMFERAPRSLVDEGWDGYHGDSYFSGVVIKVSRDGEEYKIGTYFS